MVLGKSPIILVCPCIVRILEHAKNRSMRSGVAMLMIISILVLPNLSLNVPAKYAPAAPAKRLQLVPMKVYALCSGKGVSSIR